MNTHGVAEHVTLQLLMIAVMKNVKSMRVQNITLFDTGTVINWLGD